MSWAWYKLNGEECSSNGDFHLFFNLRWWTRWPVQQEQVRNSLYLSYPDCLCCACSVHAGMPFPIAARTTWTQRTLTTYLYFIELNAEIITLTFPWIEQECPLKAVLVSKNEFLLRMFSWRKIRSSCESHDEQKLKTLYPHWKKRRTNFFFKGLFWSLVPLRVKFRVPYHCVLLRRNI